MKYWAAFAVMDIAVIISMLFMKSEINISTKRLFKVFLLGLTLFIINFELTPEPFRIIANIFIYLFLGFIIFKENIKQSILSSMLVFVLNIVVELLYGVISMSFIEHEIFMLNSALLVFIQNLILGIMLILLSYLLSKYGVYYKILNKINKIRSRQIIIFSLLSIVLFNLLLWITYFVSQSLYNNDLLILVGSAISIFSAVFLFVYLKTNSSYKEVAEKYDLSLKNIEEYEKMIDASKLNNHETRNHFLTIRNMSKNKKITNYIDSLLDNKINDSEQLLSEVSRLPRGGLRGLIYSKLLDIKEKKINYNLLIDKKVSMTKFSKIEDDLIVDICKILGVFLDNAIEAVELLKEKDIVIEIYADKKDIVFAITNNFIGELEIDELSTTKYSTKGNGRGYGLTLVKDIINKSNKLENLTEIYEDNFTQILKIKM